MIILAPTYAKLIRDLKKKSYESLHDVYSLVVPLFDLKSRLNVCIRLADSINLVLRRIICSLFQVTHI